jgi:hypothetical protein
MIQPIPIQPNSSNIEAEETLRLLAELPAPAGLEERIHTVLKAAPVSTKILAWPVQNGEPLRSWMRGVAAAAIVSVVAGGGWAIYSRVPQAAGPKVVELPRVTGSGGFSSAGAMRTPQTLNAPSVAQAAVPQSSATAPQSASAKKPAHRRTARSTQP